MKYIVESAAMRVEAQAAITAAAARLNQDEGEK